MADKKITQLTELTAIADDDFLAVVDTSATVTKKIRKDNLFAGLLPTGSMVEYAAAAEPDGWLLCNGQAVSRSTYAALFSLIGTQYGDGDGSTTFNVPDKRKRVGVGYDPDDTDFDELGATGGEKAHTQTVNELAAHAHGHNNPSHHHGVNDPGHRHNLAGMNEPSPAGTNARFVDWAPGGVDISPDGMQHSGTGISIQGNTLGLTISSAGGGQPFNVMQPYLVVNHIIKT